MIRFLVIPLAILLSGCEIGQVFQQPEIDLPDRYSLLADVSAPSRNDLEWWHNFNDPILDSLVRQGLAGNLSLAQARERVREAEAIARRDGVPVTGNGEIQTRGNTNDRETGEVRLGAAYNLAGASRFRGDAARSRLEAARLDELDARRLLLSEITVAYIDLRFFQRNLGTLGQDVTSRTLTVREVNTQLQAGAATRLDSVRSASLLAVSRAQIPSVKADIVQQRNRISTLLGIPVGQLNIDLRDRGKQPLPRMVAKLGVPADLIRARPDIRSAERDYAAAVSDINAAQADRYPSLSLSGVITAPLSGISADGTLSAGLILPVFSQPALAASVDAAQARSNLAYITWRRLVLSAVEDVENALASLQGSRAATRGAREVVSLNEESLHLSRQLFEGSNQITILDILDSERDLSISRRVLNRNTRDMAVDYVALSVALGQGHELISEPQPKVARQVVQFDTE